MVDPYRIVAEATRRLSGSTVRLDRNHYFVHNHFTIVLSEQIRENFEPVRPHLQARIHSNLDRELQRLNDPKTPLQRIAALVPWMGRRIYLRNADRWKVEFTFDEDLQPGQVTVHSSILRQAATTAEGGRTIPYVETNATMPARFSRQAGAVPAGWIRFTYSDRDGTQVVDAATPLVRVGRDPSCEVVLNTDDVVSRCHLEFRLLADGSGEVRNVGQNGSALDGKPLGADWTPLPQKCDIDVGGMTLAAERT